MAAISLPLAGALYLLFLAHTSTGLNSAAVEACLQQNAGNKLLSAKCLTQLHYSPGPSLGIHLMVAAVFAASLVAGIVAYALRPKSKGANASGS